MRCRYKTSCTNDASTFVVEPGGAKTPVCEPCNEENTAALKRQMEQILARKSVFEDRAAKEDQMPEGVKELLEHLKSMVEKLPAVGVKVCEADLKTYGDHYDLHFTLVHGKSRVSHHVSWVVSDLDSTSQGVRGLIEAELGAAFKVLSDQRPSDEEG